MSQLIHWGLCTLARTPLCKVSSIRRLVDRASCNAYEVERFIKFAIVGTIGAIVDFSVLNFFVLVIGLPKVWANTISFSAAVLSNFTWNRLWSFPESRARPLRTQLPQFALVNLIGLGINQIVFLGLDHLIFDPLLGELGYNVAKAIAILIVLFWNYGANRAWTYRGL